ncbi:MAG: hypothetical protein HYY20_01720 [Candidatus Tectomicrobia bacterium]|uniref:Uncharacterized protein n=1 Tax=Tectimicrobiota bacterium TaxID=2528274 RepID=A0A932FUG7_UNCTE|nr:hypothetical protein [Candidatus Tectomicrobia bacterium]
MRERQLYFGKRSTGKGGRWTSFEDHPRLSQTKGNIYGRCVPCMEELWSQLDQGREAIRLGRAYHCWKVAVVLPSEEHCLTLLALFEERFLADHDQVYGRYGTASPESPTQVVVFNAYGDPARRDRLRQEVALCAQEIDPGAEVFVNRACTNLYAELLGPWEAWEEETPILWPERVETVKERIKRLLYQ